MTALLEALGLKLGVVVGGFIGSVVSLRFAQGLSLTGKLSMVFGGLAAAAYLTPLVSLVIDLKAPIESGIAFLIGLYGMSAIAEGYKFISSGEAMKLLRQKLGG